MKQINYEDKFSSSTKTAYLEIAQSEIEKHVHQTKIFNNTVRQQLKSSSIEYGFDPVADYKTMKNLMHDKKSGFVQNASNYIKNRRASNNILP